MKPPSDARLLWAAAIKADPRGWARWARRARNMRKVRMLLKMGHVTERDVKVLKP